MKNKQKLLEKLLEKQFDLKSSLIMGGGQTSEVTHTLTEEMGCTDTEIETLDDCGGVLESCTEYEC